MAIKEHKWLPICNIKKYSAELNGETALIERLLINRLVTSSTTFDWYINE
jgi:hypothetical protein